MKKEHKELLLKDLCARLPYGVMIEGLEHPEVMTIKHLAIISAMPAEPYKPYLRSISSMTEDEFVYFMGLRGRMLKSYEIQSIMKESFNMPLFIGIGTTLGSYSNKIDWLNAHHFDYRGLIKLGLALEAPEGMYQIN